MMCKQVYTKSVLQRIGFRWPQGLHSQQTTIVLFIWEIHKVLKTPGQIAGLDPAQLQKGKQVFLKKGKTWIKYCNGWGKTHFTKATLICCYHSGSLNTADVTSFALKTRGIDSTEKLFLNTKDPPLATKFKCMFMHFLYGLFYQGKPCGSYWATLYQHSMIPS